MEPEPSWNWSPGHELAPGLLAWALLGDGRRCETWLAWDLGRWCPVAVKLPRPGAEPARAVAGLAQEAQVAAVGRPPRDPAAARVPPRPAPATSRLRVRRGPDPGRRPGHRRAVPPGGRAADRHAAGRRPRPPARPGPGPPGRQAGQRGAARRAAGADRPRPGPARRRGPGGPAPARLPALDGPRTGPPPSGQPGHGPVRARGGPVRAGHRDPGLRAARRRPGRAPLAPAGRPATPGQQPQPARCRPPSTGPSPPCWPPTRPTARPPPARCSPCSPRPCRPTPAEEDRLWPIWATGRLGTWQASTIGASPARFTTCVGLAGGAQILLVRMVAPGKTSSRPGTQLPGQALVGVRGGRGRVHALTRRRAPTGALNLQRPADPRRSQW